jgi:formylmethanofuran dehydrogenase subunit D
MTEKLRRREPITLSEKSVTVTLITGRTIDQGVALEGSKLTQAYVKAAAVCYMDPEDMKKIGVITGDIVSVKTDFGQVILRVVKSEDTPHVGIVFVPMGPWANQLVDPNTNSIGMPSFKEMKATIELAQGSKILDAATLVKTAYKKP